MSFIAEKYGLKNSKVKELAETYFKGYQFNFDEGLSEVSVIDLVKKQNPKEFELFEQFLQS